MPRVRIPPARLGDQEQGRARGLRAAVLLGRRKPENPCTCRHSSVGMSVRLKPGRPQVRLLVTARPTSIVAMCHSSKVASGVQSPGGPPCAANITGDVPGSYPGKRSSRLWRRTRAWWNGRHAILKSWWTGRSVRVRVPQPARKSMTTGGTWQTRPALEREFSWFETRVVSNASVAHLAERHPRKVQAVGSRPTGGSGCRGVVIHVPARKGERRRSCLRSPMAGGASMRGWTVWVRIPPWTRGEGAMVKNVGGRAWSAAPRLGE
jgi:hypothetical protein